MTTTSTATIAPHHVTDVLAPRGLTEADAIRFGLRSVMEPGDLPSEFSDHPLACVPALLIPWRSPTGGELLQLRPDTPIESKKDNPVKYLFPNGSVMVLNRIVEPAPDAPILLVEGTFQSHVAAVYAPDGWAVYGLSGCWNWRNGDTQTAIPDLIVCEGRDVVIGLDADAATNRHVYDAGMALADAIRAEDAGSVGFLQLPGAGRKAGLDDVLASRPLPKRKPWLARQVVRPAERPSAVKPKLTVKSTKKANPYIDPQQGGLQVVSLAAAVREKAPVLLTQEDKVAVYANGVFRTDGTILAAILGDLLGEQYRTSHRGNVEDYLVGQLARAGERTPMHASEALLNVVNGMLDLATGTLKPHDPVYRSTAQIPVEWDADASCPTYERWITDVAGDQVDDLEEVASTMLDPSRTPTKSVFLYGPSRSGKSTFIRLMEAMVGPENRSGVTLHQLCENRFMAANVYGKMLNAAADLSGAAVEDLSVYKLMTGEDVIQADRKFGSQFAFTNRALFAFSANELPTVGESSRAYVERIKPFRFDRSFAGAEDPTIERRMIAWELPGILVRWVHAWQRLSARGTYQATDAEIRREFEVRSDRVRQWVEEDMIVVPVTGSMIEPGSGSTPRELAHRFQQWADRNAGSRMGERKILDRLRQIEGVADLMEKGTNRRVMNIVTKDKMPTLTVVPEPVTEPVAHSNGQTEEPGEEWPVTFGPADVLDRLAVDVPPRLCPDCDAPEDLVPPTFLWSACRHCSPATFTWSW